MQIFTPKGTHLAISCTKKGKIKIIRVHIWRFRVLKRGKLKLSGGFANENINNHRQFPSNSV